MSDSVLKLIDFASYRELLDALLPDSYSIALTDSRGTVVAADDDFPEAVLGASIPEAALEPGGADSSSVPPFGVNCDEGKAFVAPIATEEHGVIALIWASGPPVRIASLKWLTTIASQISKDLSLNEELDAMASELSDRYEELNLVYHTADQVTYFAEGQEALVQLVRNCCDYLNVCCSFLIMKGKGIAISHSPNQSDCAVSESLAEKIGDSVYDAVVSSREPVVINHVESPDALRYWQGQPYRLLCVPVLDSSDHCDGVIAIVNKYSGNRFHNSDKNLLQVMARKASKILQVSYDSLTGLVNREGLEYAAEQLLQGAHAQASDHSVLHVDIDRIHVINDTVSHDAGDAVIVAVADLLQRMTRDTDSVCRIGGDKFGVLLHKCPIDRGSDIAEKLRQGIAELIIPWDERTLAVTVCIGVAPLSQHSKSAEAVLAAAELACQAAQEIGTNRIQRFIHEDTNLMRRQSEMEAIACIQDALKSDAFILYAQPIKALQSDDCAMHVEILLRMQGKNREVIAPGEFLPAAERYHLMPDIDRWVARKALWLLKTNWDELANRIGVVSINLSGQTLSEPEIIQELTQLVLDSGVPPDRICFEVTETAAIANLKEARELISGMKKIGCRISLDDFGSGVSSFQYLRTLPVDYLKIDGSLVRGIDDDEVAASMVAAIRQVASVMHLQTIGEFVESEAIEAKLRELGVDYGQGYAIARPVPLAQILSAGGVADRTEVA